MTRWYGYKTVRGYVFVKPMRKNADIEWAENCIAIQCVRGPVMARSRSDAKQKLFRTEELRSGSK